MSDDRPIPGQLGDGPLDGRYDPGPAGRLGTFADANVSDWPGNSFEEIKAIGISWDLGLCGDLLMEAIACWIHHHVQGRRVPRYLADWLENQPQKPVTTMRSTDERACERQPGMGRPASAAAGPELIREAEQAIRHAHSVMDPDAGFWLEVAATSTTPRTSRS